MADYLIDSVLKCLLGTSLGPGTVLGMENVCVGGAGGGDERNGLCPHGAYNTVEETDTKQSSRNHKHRGCLGRALLRGHITRKLSLFPEIRQPSLKMPNDLGDLHGEEKQGAQGLQQTQKSNTSGFSGFAERVKQTSLFPPWKLCHYRVTMISISQIRKLRLTAAKGLAKSGVLKVD